MDKKKKKEGEKKHETFFIMFIFVAYKIFEGHNKWKKIAAHKIPILSLVGKKTIWIYLLHQPISMLICNLLFR